MYSAGTVFLQVVPSYRGFQESVRRQAKEAAKAFKGEFEKETGHSIADAIDKSTPDARKAAEKLGADTGERMGGKMHDAVQKRLRSAFKSLPPIEIKADSSKVDREIALIRARLAEIGNAHADMTLDTTSAVTQLAEVEALLNRVQRDIERGSSLDIDTGAAAAHLAEVSALATAAGKDVTINVEADTGSAMGKLAAIKAMARNVGAGGDDAANSFRAFNGVILAAATLGPTLIPVLAALAGGLAAIGPMAIAAGSGLGVLILGLSGIPNAVGALNDVAKNGAKDALAAEKTMRGAANGIRNAEQGLARARQDAARSQADSARRVADARRSLADAERQSSQAIADALRREADARENAKDVAIRNAREIEQAERRLADARQAVTRARADQDRQNADAARRVADAEHGIVEAQQNALKAQNDLNDAREQAARDLEDLNLKAQGGALAEREAVLAVADAKKQYDRVMGREFKSDRSVEEVTLAYQEAQLALEQVRLQNKRTGEELAEANANGIEGSDAVTAARERLTEAQQNELDAIQTLADAQADADQTRLDAAERVNDALVARKDAVIDLSRTEADTARAARDAQQEVRDAVDGVREARLDAARTVADAERGVTDAIREQHRAGVDAAAAIASAQQGLADAQAGYADALQSTGELGSASMQKLSDAMGQLSPAGQDFARFIFGLKDDFLALRGAAEAGLLPGLQTFLETVIDKYGPGFTKWVGKMAKVAGDLFVEFGNMLTQNPLWKEFFATFDKISPKLFRQFGLTTLNWLTVFVTLMEAFAPLALKFSDALLKLSERAVDWAGTLEDTQGFQDFLGYVERVGPKVAEFFKQFFLAVINIGRALAPFGEVVLDMLTNLLAFIAGMDPKVLGYIVTGILGLVIALQAAYAVSTLLLVGTAAFATTTGIVVFAVIALATAVFLLYQRFETFRTIVDVVLQVIGASVKFFWEYTVWAWGQVADATTWLWQKVLSPIFGFIGDAFGVLVDGIKWAWENILHPTWTAISDAATWLWEKVLSPVFGFIRSAWRVLADAIAWVWNNIWFPVIDLVSTIIWDLWKVTLRVVFGLISDGWGKLADGVAWAWEHVIRPAWDALGGFIHDTWFNVIKPIFDFFAETLHGKEGLTWVFEQAVSAIKNIWEGLQDIAKAPIKFIVETVINGGLIGTFNKIADFFGTKQMKEIPLPKGFATGGYTGPGSRYQVAGIVHADEYVISAPARRAFEARNPGMLDAINRGYPGYAKGGVVRPVNAAYGLPFGNTYSDGSFHSGQDFPVGIGTKVVAAIMGVVSKVLHLADSYGNHVVMKHPGGSETLYAHLSKTLVNAGQVLGAGALLGLSGTSGNSTGPHLHFEFRTPPGGYSHAINPLGILGGAPLPSGDDGGFFPDWMSNPFSYLKGKVTGPLKKLGDSPYASLLSEVPLSLLGMAGDAIGGFGKNILGKAGSAASSAWDFVNGPFGGAGDNAGVYDTGGMLPPGITHLMNASGKPEAVLTNDQWQQIQRVADGGHGAPGLTTGDLYAVDPDEMVRKIRKSQSDAAAITNLRSIASGAGL
jgi:phage-related protein